MVSKAMTLKQRKKTIMKGRFRAKKIQEDYHTLDRAGQVTLICLCTGHNILNSHMHRRMNLVPTRVPNTTLQQTSSPDITTMSNTLYNQTSWTTQHTLLSDLLPIITTINIRHDYRLQQISAPKSTVTLFTPDKHQFQMHPVITLEDTQLPLERSTKILGLGVIMDPSLSFHRHCNYVSDRIDKRNNMLKALAESSRGPDKETADLQRIGEIYRKLCSTSLEHQRK